MMQDICCYLNKGLHRENSGISPNEGSMSHICQMQPKLLRLKVISTIQHGVAENSY